MNLLDLLRNIVNRKGKNTPRVGMEMYEETLNVGQQNLIRLIHEIAERQSRSPEDVANEILSHGIEAFEELDGRLKKWNTLSSREQQVAALTCMGYSTEEIAQRFVISPNTIKSHLRNIQQKFGVNSKEELKQLFKGWDFKAFDD